MAVDDRHHVPLPTAVAAYLSTGSSVISDVFPPEQRGMANGMFMIPILFGPILGPLIGGAIAEVGGARAGHAGWGPFKPRLVRLLLPRPAGVQCDSTRR